MEIKITEENLRKAHAEGCSDVKKVLETLAPDLFKVKYPCFGKYWNGEVVLFTEKNVGVSVIKGDSRHEIGHQSNSWGDNFTPIKGVKEIEREKSRKGENKMFKVESDFIYNGLRCIVIFAEMGHRCGYVGIAEGHKLYGLDYSDLELDIDVHGGLTYSGSGEEGYPVKSPLWFFGFDCAHLGDARDLMSAQEYGFDLLPYSFDLGGTVRGKEYVESQCRSLADQILEAA